MLPVMLIVEFLLCVVLLCLCNGAKFNYSPEENKFLVDEVSKYPDYFIPVYGDVMWKPIAKKFHDMALSYPTVFQTKRTPRGLKSRFLRKMQSSKEDEKLPDELMKRLDKSPQIKESNIQGDEPIECHRKKRARKSRVGGDEYTPDEDKLIFHVVRNYPRKPPKPVRIHSKKLWQHVLNEFKFRKDLNLNERSQRSVEQRFFYILDKKMTAEDRASFLQSIGRIDPRKKKGRSTMATEDAGTSTMAPENASVVNIDDDDESECDDENDGYDENDAYDNNDDDDENDGNDTNDGVEENDADDKNGGEEENDADDKNDGDDWWMSMIDYDNVGGISDDGADPPEN